MDAETTASALAALGQRTRLDAVRLLASEAEGLSAGEIGRRLGVAQNAMSAHLKTLSAAGILRSVRTGRTIVYSADAGVINDLILRLTTDLRPR